MTESQMEKNWRYFITLFLLASVNFAGATKNVEAPSDYGGNAAECVCFKFNS